MSIVEKESRRGDRHLQRACEYVQDLWFPASPRLISTLKEAIHRDEIREPREVLREVRKDFSLYMYCLRELARQVRSSDPSIRFDDPISLFERAGINKIAAVLNEAGGTLSSHSLSSLSELQGARIEEAYVSATTTGALASVAGIDEERGFAFALIRHLGFTLVAFNYPTVYEESIKSLKHKELLDAKIAERLGFTPSLLAISLLQQWGFTIGTASSRAVELTAIGQTLQRLAEVGEALARANQPHLYQSASKDWEVARYEIEEALGKKGIGVLRKKLKESLREYVSAVPTLFKGGIILDPEAKLSFQWSERHLQLNPFIDGCSEPLQGGLHRFYEIVTRGEGARQCVGNVVQTLIPLSGFEAGIIYTIDPTVALLVPQLKIGTVTLRSSSPVAYVTAGDLISQAYQSTSPVVKTVAESSGGYRTSVAGILGYSQRVGVLYLEIDHSLFERPEKDYLIHFKAISKAFTDALGLG